MADREQLLPEILGRYQALCARIDEQTLRDGEKPLAQAIAEQARQNLEREGGADE